MATAANLAPGATPRQNSNDPFVSTPSPFHSAQLRYATLDNDQFTSYSTNSPAQARRALEAHLKETDRRIHDAAKLGNTLLEQKKSLSARLKDVENVNTDDEVPAALRQKLAELEKEYNEVGRESARAFLPKLRPSQSEATTLSGQGGSSPTKVLAPSRRQRNQPNARVHDIEFATEISTSLLAQVRQLQAALAEKDVSLKETAAAKAQLETDVTGLAQKVKQLDERTQNFKDENWNLEGRIQELESALKTSADNEQRLGQSLKSTETEKTTTQRDLDELKVIHDKAVEAHLDAKRQQDTDLHTLRRDVANHQADKEALQMKIDELNNNNKELARAVSYRFNQSAEDSSIPGDLNKSDDEHDETIMDLDMSPIKGTPARPGMLESETLKSSLNHAHRMIQNLKNTIHREKSEKLDLRRMLNDARDELEKRRVDGGTRAATDKGKKRNVAAGVRRPTRLGANGAATTEVLDDDWEDDEQKTPSKRNFSAAMPGAFVSATDTESTDAFETADELRETTETEGFQTGAETLGEDSDELTETESGNRRSTLRAASHTLAGAAPGERRSFLSTASTSSDEGESRLVRTPNQSVGPKYRLRVSKSGRRSLRHSQILADSPASNNSTPQNISKTLGDELDGLDDDSIEGTPSKILDELDYSSPPTQRSISTTTPIKSRDAASPFVVAPPLPHMESSPAHEGDETVLVHDMQRPTMVDAGVMTEPWQPEKSTRDTLVAAEQPSAQGFVVTKELDASEDAETAKPIGIEAASTEETVGEAAVMNQPVAAERVVDEESSSTPLKGIGERLVDAAGGALAGFGLGRVSKEKSSDVATAPQEHTAVKEESLPQQEHAAVNGASVPQAITTPLTFSSILAQEYEPIAAPISAPASIPLLPKRSSRRLGSLESSPVDERSEMAAMTIPSVTPQTLAAGSQPSAASEKEATHEYVEPVVYGGGKGANGIPTLMFGDEPDNIVTTTARHPMQEISPNVVPKEKTAQEHDVLPITKPLQIRKPMLDEGSQTVVSGQDIDNMMRDKTAVAASEDGPRSPRRPGSAGSVRHRVATPTPPLPPDHTEKIAAASKTPAPTTVPGSMGPPLLPASAYRNKRPITPNERSLHTMSRDGTTPRPVRPSVRDSSASGRLSRSTSVSSFASELDERFKIGRGHLMYPDDVAPATDPRMIQAITQTMIGEYLWKYTRKAGRVETSTTRHRRFFWVHPYTRTLYWSEQDPSTTNKGMMKAKSVPIESVRVITDDNVNPPGLHRKSIVIISRSREIVVTAPTSQRHETWFNALSYLLLRSSNEKEADDTINDEDLEEFNPGGFSFRRSISKMTRGRSTSRVSLSSYNSRTTRNSSPAKRESTQPAEGQRSQSNAPVAGSTSSRAGRDSSRFSSMASRFSTVRGGARAGSSLSNREGDIYNASIIGESAEDVRRIIERQDRDANMLENVRACCDGKHDVGSLSRNGRHMSLRPRMSGSNHNQHSKPEPVS